MSQDTNAPRYIAPRSLAPLTPWVWVLAAGKLLLHLAVINRYGYFRDELYNLACSRHLAWGYVDQPALVSGVTWIVRHTLGESLFALRLFPALIMSTVVVLGGVLARRLGGGRYAQALTALALALSPAFVVMGTILTVNAFDILWWTLAIYLLVRLIEGERKLLWLMLGVVFGLGLQTKFNIAFLAVGLLWGVLLTRQRVWLTRPWAWSAVGVAAVLFLPCLRWQQAHGWATFEFLRNIRADKNYPVSPIEFAAMQFAVVHPMLFPIWVAGLVWLFRACSAKPFRLFGWTYAALFVIFMILQAKFYYLFPIYPIIIAAGGVALERWTTRKRRGWWRVAIPVVVLVGTLATLPMAAPVLSLPTFERYNEAIDLQRHLRFEKGRDRHLPIVYSDMLGWPELAQAVAKQYDILEQQGNTQIVVLTQNYGEAGAIDEFGRSLGLPQARSPHNAYYTWGPGDVPWDTVIAVGFDDAQLRECFADVTLLETVEHPLAREREIPLYFCRKPKQSVDALWQALRHYR